MMIYAFPAFIWNAKKVADSIMETKNAVLRYLSRWMDRGTEWTVSQGCRLIRGGKQWDDFNKQLSGVSKFHLQVNRKFVVPYRLPY